MMSTRRKILRAPFIVLVLILGLGLGCSPGAGPPEDDVSAIIDATVRQLGEGAGPFEDGVSALESKDYATALRILRPLADQGHAGAQFSLGTMHEDGQGVAQDYGEALNWYRKAADQGHARAQFSLGLMYDFGRGVAQSDGEALNWYRKAADQGHAGAQTNLGVMYYSGQGVAQDYGEALNWYRKAADQGHASAQSNLGVMYENGRGVAQDYVQAHKWYSLAAERRPAADRAAAVSKRDENVALHMTPAQIAEAERLAREWQPGSAASPSQQAASAPGSPDYQPGRPSTSDSSGDAAAAPGSPDYQPGQPSESATGRSAAPATAAAPPPGAIAAGMSCEDVLNSLIGPVNDTAAGSNLSPAQAAQESVWAMQTYLRVANTHPACANDAQSRQLVASMLRQEQDRCRESGSPNCESGQNFTGTATRTEAAIRKLFQESPAAAGSAANAPSAGGECTAAVDRQEAEFIPISQRIANMESAVSQMQLLLGMLTKRMALLDRLCKGQPQYALYAETKEQFDSTMRACRGLASNPGDCVAQ